MTGTRTGWGVGALSLALYPFGAGAMVVNLYFAGLIGSWLGWDVMSPNMALIGGAVLGIPATWAFARHIRGMMDRIDAETDAENG
ncbi:NnrT protein [Pelagivirga sediminicola]|uniref:NnrT protein n=1 Tax=Pelagivirga sediminicola TaxID=2170575 RepID=A0A2T7G8F0_9RHOB|nr:NnrT protein [Pelagivirga sediminicola]PVA10677.1 NnrT protein [Pelagivirga sediminicola]